VRPNLVGAVQDTTRPPTLGVLSFNRCWVVVLRHEPKGGLHQLIFFLPWLLCFQVGISWATRWNRILTQLRVHPQLSDNGHPVDDVRVCTGGCWFVVAHLSRLILTMTMCLQIVADCPPQMIARIISSGKAL